MSPDKLKNRKLKKKSIVDKEIIEELRTQEKKKKKLDLKKKIKLDLRKKRKMDKGNGVGSVADDQLSCKDDDAVVETNHEDFDGECKSVEKKTQEKKKKNKLDLKKKSKLDLKKKRKRDKGNGVGFVADDQLSCKDDDAVVETNHKDFDGECKSLEKKRKRKKNKLGLKLKENRENENEVDPNSDDRVSADEDAGDGMMHPSDRLETDHAKSLTISQTLSVTAGEPVSDCGSKIKTKKGKKEKKHKTKETHISTERKKEETQAGVEQEVDEISTVDEDCSRGMKKWLIKYKESRPGLSILQQRIDDYITAYEEQNEQERKEREAKAAEGGWTVVVHHKGRKKTTDTESGVTVGSVAQAAVVDKMGRKKSKEPPLDFYRFQKREARRNEVMLLQSKFEQDKKRIQQLRAARKFRPY